MSHDKALHKSMDILLYFTSCAAGLLARVTPSQASQLPLKRPLDTIGAETLAVTQPTVSKH